MRKSVLVTITVLVALLTLSTLLPTTVRSPGPQLAEAKILTLTPTVPPSEVTPIPPEPAPEATAAYYRALRIWVDRGEGATYRVCDPIQVCYSIPYAVYIRIWDITPAGSRVILQGYDDGTGGCFWATIVKPLGIETLRIEMIEGGRVTGQAETWFYVSDAGPLSAWIWTDRGEGSTYRIGDPMRLCYDVSRPAYVEIWTTTSEGSRRMLAGYDDGTGDCFLGTVGAPTGIHRYRIEGYDCPPGYYPLASDETWVNVVQPVPIRVPTDGLCRVRWVDVTSNICSGEFGLHTPQRFRIFANYAQRPSPDYQDIGPFSAGTELVFYIQPWGTCGGEYLSTSPNARVTDRGSGLYRIEWEDLPPERSDNDYNDLVVDVECGIQPPCPIGVSPYNGLNARRLEPGDVLMVNASKALRLLVGWFGGYWGHTAIYAGDGYIVESYGDGYFNPEPGVTLLCIGESPRFWEARDWTVLRANTTQAKKNQAVQYARDQYKDKDPYNWNVLDKWPEDRFFCTQLVWRSYYEGSPRIDIDSNWYGLLCPFHPYYCLLAPSVPPGDIYHDKDLTEVFAKRCPKGNCKRAVLFLGSSANFYITDPQGRHTGVDPATGQIIEEIPSVLYYSGPDEEVEYVVIEDLEGAWNVRIIGTETGSYTLISKVVDQKDPVIDHVAKTTSPGKVDEFLITYPTTPGEPIRLTGHAVYLPLINKNYAR